jgi:hypothetical protein
MSLVWLGRLLFFWSRLLCKPVLRSGNREGPPVNGIDPSSHDAALTIDDLKAMWYRTSFPAPGVALCLSFGLIDR